MQPAEVYWQTHISKSLTLLTAETPTDLELNTGLGVTQEHNPKVVTLSYWTLCISHTDICLNKCRHGNRYCPHTNVYVAVQKFLRTLCNISLSQAM
jgi:hypothetical protein